MNILVTGAAGQLGSYIVDTLGDNHDVIGLDLRPGNGKNINQGDIKDYRLAMQTSRGMDIIIHTAAQVSVDRSISDPVMDANENILGTINMLEAAAKAMAKQFIYISSAAIFGNPVSVPIDEEHPTNPMSPYGASKLAGEKYAFAFQESYGLNATAIRPFNIFSPRQDPQSPYSGVITKFIELAREGKPLSIHGKGDQTRDFVHALDVVSMVEKCIGNQKAYGQSFNCGTSEATSIKELAEIINEISGNDAGTKHTESRKGDIKHSVADISKAREKLDFSPSIGLKQGLEGLL